MKKIFILLFIFFGSSLFADTDWFIYTYNDVSSIADIMRFLSFVDQDSTYQNILYLAIVFGFFMAAFMKKVFNVEAMGIQMLSVVGLMAFIFGARTDVHIVNVKTFSSMQEGKSYEKVANVPFAFAFTGSTLSNIGYSMARLLNNGIGHVNGDKYSELSFIKSGMLGGSDIYVKMLKTELAMMSEKGAAFQNYYNSYLKQCAIGRGMAYTDDMVDILKNSKDLMTDIDPLNIMGKTGVDIRPDLVDFPTGRVSCNDAYLATLNEYNSFKNSGEIEEYFKKQFKDKFENPTEVVSAVTQVYGLQNGASSADNIRQFSLAAGMMGQVNSALSAYLGDGMSDAAMLYGGFGAGLSNASLIQSGMSKSFYSGQQLPYLMEILNFVMYALFPFVFVATIASAQLKILKNFFLAMLWIQLWPVTFEALAYFINKDMIYAATSSLVAAGAGHVTEDNILTMSLLPHLNEAIASQSAQAANLMWSVPIISGFLLSGSWTALMGMASNIGAHSAAAANTADLQRKQAEMAFEQKLLQDTNNAWTPTASQMARAGIDAELLGTAKTSSTALAEIEKLGSVGNAINTAAQSGALQSLAEQTKLLHMRDSDFVNSAYTEAVKKKIDNETLSGNIVQSGGEEEFKKDSAKTNVAYDQANIQKTSMLIDKFGGLENLINSVATAESYDVWSKTNKLASHEDAFNQLYTEFGGERTKDEFLKYMATQEGKAEIAHALGAARVLEKTNDTTLVATGRQNQEKENATTNANNITAKTLNTTTEQLFNTNEKIKTLTEAGKYAAEQKVANHIAPDATDPDQALVLSAQRRASTFKYADNDGAKRDVALGENGVGYDSTDKSLIFKDNVTHEQKSVFDTRNEDKSGSESTRGHKETEDNSTTVNNDNVFSERIVNDQSIKLDTSVLWNGWSQQVLNDNAYKAFMTDDVNAFEKLMHAEGLTAHAAKSISVTGLLTTVKDITMASAPELAERIKSKNQ